MAVAAIGVMAALSGCQGAPHSRSNPALKSEREYAVSSEARAQDLARAGQASTIGEARARATAEANTECAAAATAAERKARQREFEKELGRTLGTRN